jgi:ankyrin repeat protein
MYQVYNEVILTVDNLSNTPLHSAAANGQLECAITLIVLADGLLQMKDSFNCTFLHSASYAGQDAFIVGLFTSQEFDGNTHAKILKLLQDQDCNGRTPLLCAAASGSLASVKALEEFGSNIFSVDYVSMRE